jgi:hypothetical protein
MPPFSKSQIFILPAKLNIRFYIAFLARFAFQEAYLVLNLFIYLTVLGQKYV